jgi:hypothetical protein
MNKKQFAKELEAETVRLLLEGRLTQKQIAIGVGVSLSYVQAVAKRRGCQRKPGLGSPAYKTVRVS